MCQIIRDVVSNNFSATDGRIENRISLHYDCLKFCLTKKAIFMRKGHWLLAVLGDPMFDLILS
jgi:hypothetical protein